MLFKTEKHHWKIAFRNIKQNKQTPKKAFTFFFLNKNYCAIQNLSSKLECHHTCIPIWRNYQIIAIFILIPITIVIKII